MTTIIEPDVREDEQTTLDPGDVAHRVYNGDGGVTKAYVEGTALEALCGYRWVPSKDPKSKPECQACRAIYDDNEAIQLADPRKNPEGQ